MKSKLISTLALTALLAAPALAMAQSQNNAPLTRQDVKAQLIQLERAGYNPSQNDLSYPSNIQRAQQRVNSGAYGNGQ